MAAKIYKGTCTSKECPDMGKIQMIREERVRPVPAGTTVQGTTICSTCGGTFDVLGIGS